MNSQSFPKLSRSPRLNSILNTTISKLLQDWPPTATQLLIPTDPLSSAGLQFRTPLWSSLILRILNSPPNCPPRTSPQVLSLSPESLSVTSLPLESVSLGTDSSRTYPQVLHFSNQKCPSPLIQDSKTEWSLQYHSPLSHWHCSPDTSVQLSLTSTAPQILVSSCSVSH